jgi:hypothetical protein
LGAASLSRFPAALGRSACPPLPLAPPNPFAGVIELVRGSSSPRCEWALPHIRFCVYELGESVVFRWCHALAKRHLRKQGGVGSGLCRLGGRLTRCLSILTCILCCAYARRVF